MDPTPDTANFTDCTGRKRIFRFEVLETPSLISVKAIEQGKEFRYQFKEFGTPGDYHLLHDRIATALSRRHIVRDRSGISRWEMLSNSLQGRIDYNRDDQDICLVIDGEKATWEEFKDLVTTHEGSGSPSSLMTGVTPRRMPLLDIRTTGPVSHGRRARSNLPRREAGSAKPAMPVPTAPRAVSAIPIQTSPNPFGSGKPTET